MHGVFSLNVLTLMVTRLFEKSIVIVNLLQYKDPSKQEIILGPAHEELVLTSRTKRIRLHFRKKLQVTSIALS